MKTIRILTTTFTLLLALGATATATAAGAASLAGTWKLDTTRGANLGMMSAMLQTQTITQTPAALTIHEAIDFQGQKSERDIRYDLSGKPAMNPAAMGGVSETVAVWSDGKLVVTWTSEGTVAGTKNVRTETRSVSADGKTMTVESVRGTNKPLVMVFEKLK